MLLESLMHTCRGHFRARCPLTTQTCLGLVLQMGLGGLQLCRWRYWLMLKNQRLLCALAGSQCH